MFLRSALVDDAQLIPWCLLLARMPIDYVRGFCGFLAEGYLGVHFQTSRNDRINVIP